MAGENINRRLNIYINDKEVVNSFSGIGREIAKTKNELKHLNKNQDDYDDRVKQLTKHLGDLTERQDEFKDELKLTNKELGAARENFSNLLAGIATGDMKAIQSGLMGIRGSLMSTIEAGMAFVATPVGAAIAVLAGFGMAAKAVFDFNEEIRESNELLDNLGIDEKLRPQIQGLVDTYKVGFEEIANAVDNMVDLGLVKNEFEALEQIKAGLVKAPNKNEFLSMLNENGVAAKNLGLTLQGVIDLNESFEKTGGNAQQIFSALQKSSSTLVLQSPQLKKSLESAFGGAFTTDLLTKVKSGAITYYEALDRIYKKGEETGISNRKQAQIAKDLFGKSSVAAGGYEMILKNVNAAQQKQTESLTQTQKEVQALAESNISLAESMDKALKSDGFNAWKNNAMIALNSLKQGFYEFIHDISATSKDARNDAKGSASTSTLGFLNSFKDPKEKETNAQLTKDNSISWIKEYNEQLQKAKHSFELFNEVSLKNFTPDAIKNREQASADIERLNAALGTQKGRLIAAQKVLDELHAKAAPVNDKAGAEKSDEEIKAEDDAAKKRAKELEAAKKHAEDLAKTEEDLQRRLLEIKRSGEDLHMQQIKDDYDRELALINAEYSRKIEDTLANIRKEQEEIDKLKSAISNPKTSDSDVAAYKRQLAERIQIQTVYNGMFTSLEAARNSKIGALNEKFLNLQFQKEQDSEARLLQSLRTKQNNELAEITSLEQAKEQLKDTLSVAELAKITTLEQAKKAIKEKNLQEQYNLESKNLEKIIALYEDALRGGFQSGFIILSDDEKAKVEKMLADVKEKLAEIRGTKADGSADPEKAENTGVDILGYDASDWENTFSNLDTFASKISAMKMIAGALTSAFSMYFKYLEAGENRSLKKYEHSIDVRKRRLADQLEKGFISQEIYTAKTAALDAELARKKAEIEYKQAKRKKTMDIAQAVVSTALSIMQAYAQLGPIGGTIAGVILTGIGALQIATIAKQPLPDKSGFKVGGYTGDGSPDEYAGPAHKGEYVIPQNVLFSRDPVVPNIVGYLEAKRKGRKAAFVAEDVPGVNPSGGTTAPGSGSSSMDMAYIEALNRNSAILEKIERDGVHANLLNNLENAKKIKDKIKEYDKFKSSSKA